MPETEHLAMSNNACMGECSHVVAISTCLCMYGHALACLHGDKQICMYGTFCRKPASLHVLID